jgi:prevent-host-death family protein
MASERVWQLHEAKARFSELFRLVHTQGPQHVVRHGGEEVVVVRADEFELARARATQASSLSAFFSSAPAGAARLDLSRKRDPTRTLRW